ncbi:MAG: hypothetical protein R2729_29570 [Bryobacteraceae bacterium]
MAKRQSPTATKLLVADGFEPCATLSRKLHENRIEVALAVVVPAPRPVVLIAAGRRWRRALGQLCTESAARAVFSSEPSLAFYRDLMGEASDLSLRLGRRLREAGLHAAEAKLLSGLIWAGRDRRN